MFKHTNYLILAAGLYLGMMTACSNEIEQDSPQGTGPLVQVTATIGEPNVETKANSRSDDPLSYASFADNDEIGFYSEGGLNANNQKLTLANKSFSSDDFHWGSEYATNVFAYFPYNEKANSDGMSIFKTRTQDADDSAPTFPQIEDILVSSQKEVVNGVPISLSFTHALSMLIIMRGDGFELENEDTDHRTVTVTISKAVNGIKVIGEESQTKELRLLTNLSGIDAVQTFTATESTYQNKPAWFVMVPAGTFDEESGESVKIVSISIYDSNGKLQNIKPDQEIVPASNFKYPITILKQGVRPVIQPHEIIRWTEEIIQLDQPVGIYDESNLYSWYTAYNTWIKDKTTNAAQIENLKKYGDSYTVGGDTHWRFYIRKNLSMTELEKISGYKQVSTIIKTLAGDTIDGCGYAFTGLTLNHADGEGNDSEGFVGSISGKGCIMNLTLKDLQVKGNAAIVGGFAGKIADNTTIENCHITGTSSISSTNANATLGGLVGSITEVNTTVRNCRSAAMIIGGKNETCGLLYGTGKPLTEEQCASTGSIIQLSE
ncbi:MAG: fimbrillin family protein [Parabacteroides gordonii]|nr:fimbrillin family protein [Parabacteroides gordonii]